MFNEKKFLLGMRIREIREQRKMTQEKLSELVDIDPKHLSRIENGKNYPSLDTLDKLLTNLNVEFNEVFRFEHFESDEILRNKIMEKIGNYNTKKLRFIFKMISELQQD